MYDECFSMNNFVGASLGILMSFTGVPYKNMVQPYHVILFVPTKINFYRSILKEECFEFTMKTDSRG